jgi:DNA-binding response OmpR family regulator
VDIGVTGLQLGAADYLLKPINLESLFTCMLEALEQRKFRAAGQDGASIITG